MRGVAQGAGSAVCESGWKKPIDNQLGLDYRIEGRGKPRRYMEFPAFNPLTHRERTIKVIFGQSINQGVVL